MRISHTIPLAAGLLLSSLVPAFAQSGPAPAGAPPCFNEIMPLRNEAEKRGIAIHKASDRKAPREEICKLFNSFSQAEAKYVAYAEKNATWCGIPAGAIKQMKANHTQTLKIRKQVCSVAAAPRPRGPSLSDALGTTKVPSASTTRTGRGTYDSLTGNPLDR
jgi:hypothetical protein